MKRINNESNIKELYSINEAVNKKFIIIIRRRLFQKSYSSLQNLYIRKDKIKKKLRYSK